ncbi:MAG TPA: hypothetical protein VIE65_08775 [Methylobacter sp.]|jgi:hypothetical protein
MNNFDPKFIKTAARVSMFMLDLCQSQQERWNKVKPQCIPFGDMAYGAALMKWNQDGCPKQAWFSYGENQIECPYLLEFREEISSEFKLRILTKEEGKLEAAKFTNVVTKKVHDWGIN